MSHPSVRPTLDDGVPSVHPDVDGEEPAEQGDCPQPDRNSRAHEYESGDEEQPSSVADRGPVYVPGQYDRASQADADRREYDQQGAAIRPRTVPVDTAPQPNP